MYLVLWHLVITDWLFIYLFIIFMYCPIAEALWAVYIAKNSKH